MAISRRDLMNVQDQPEVKAAIEARDAALTVSRDLYKQWQDADRVVSQRQAELEEVAGRALEAWRREVD